MWVMGRVGIVLGLSCPLVWATTAGAQTIRSEAIAVDDEPPPERRERWYGWQTLAIDGAAAGLFVGGIAIEGDIRPTLMATGAVGFAFGAPLVHGLHGHGWASAGSFALRLALTGVGTFVGAQFSNLDPCPDLPGARCEESDSSPLIAGVSIGAAAASGIDAAMLGYELAPRLSNERRYGARPAFRVAPRIGLSRGVAGFGFVGAF